MATTTGVTESKPAAGGAKGPLAGKGPKSKQQRLLLYGGGGLAAILLLSHRGGSAGQTDPNSQLQAQSDALAAEEAAMLNPPVPGGGAPVDTGGGSYTSQGPSATTAPAVTVNQPPAVVNVNVPAPPTPAGKGGPAPGRKPPGGKKPPGKGGGKGKPKGTGKGKGKTETKSTTERRTGKPGGTATKPRTGAPKTPNPKGGAKGKPAPANNKGKHPPTNSKTPSGHKKHSPAEVEAMAGFGAGVMVMGREFPGAISHRMGSPMRASDGSVCRTVSLDYGGRTETHMVHGNGSKWTDRVAGANPPSRGVPVLTGPVPV